MRRRHTSHERNFRHRLARFTCNPRLGVGDSLKAVNFVIGAFGCGENDRPVRASFQPDCLEKRLHEASPTFKKIHHLYCGMLPERLQ